jgi:hypothetical protein
MEDYNVFIRDYGLKEPIIRACLGNGGFKWIEED